MKRIVCGDRCSDPGCWCQSVIPPQPSKDAPRTGFARGPGWEGTVHPLPPPGGLQSSPSPEWDEFTEQDKIDIDRSQFEATVQEAVLKFGAATVRQWIDNFIRERAQK